MLFSIKAKEGAAAGTTTSVEDCGTEMLSQSCKMHKNEVAKTGIKDVNTQ